MFFRGYFWTSSPVDQNNALNRRLYWDLILISRFGATKETGYSVRCLQNG